MAEAGEEVVAGPAARCCRRAGGAGVPVSPSRSRTASTYSMRRRRDTRLPAPRASGIKVRITARARTLEDVTALLDKEEVEVRRAIDERLGDIIFGVDDESMEVAVAARLKQRGLTFGVAESLTGGLIASRLVNVPGTSAHGSALWRTTRRSSSTSWGCPPAGGHRPRAAAAMAEGAARVTGADVGLGIAGVTGLDKQEAVARRSSWPVASGTPTETRQLWVPGDRSACASTGPSTSDLLRRALDARIA